MTNPQYAWLDGLVDWNDANCHVSSLAFKYGAAVFEGIRAYWDGTQLNIWQLDAHLARLEDGQRFMRFTNPFSANEMREAIKQLLVANAFQDNVHITITAFLSGPGQPFLCDPCSLAITGMARGDYSTDGLNVQVSSWRRSSDSAQPQRIKSNGNYLNGRLAAVQAKQDGYDTALMLGQDGKVSEGPAMCFFMI
jgi:branched-chain amino acid aminotransferase